MKRRNTGEPIELRGGRRAMRAGGFEVCSFKFCETPLLRT